MSFELPAGQWLRRKDAESELNCSKSTLNRRKDEAYFKLGTHFIKVGPHRRSPLLWNVDECKKSLCTVLRSCNKVLLIKTIGKKLIK